MALSSIVQWEMSIVCCLNVHYIVSLSLTVIFRCVIAGSMLHVLSLIHITICNASHF